MHQIELRHERRIQTCDRIQRDWHAAVRDDDHDIQCYAQGSDEKPDPPVVQNRQRDEKAHHYDPHRQRHGGSEPERGSYPRHRELEREQRQEEEFAFEAYLAETLEGAAREQASDKADHDSIK